MGLIKAAFGAVGSTLADQWKEYIYCDSMDTDTLMQKGAVRVTGGSNTKRTDNIISDGSKVAVNEGQFMLIVENGKIVEFCGDAGAYTYQTGTEPSMFATGWQGLKDSFKKVGKRFTYGGQAENDQRVYFVNTKEILDNKIGMGDIPFRDSEFNFTMKIKGYGTYSYKITDPLMFYTNVCANVEDSYTRDTLNEQMRAEVQEAMQPALGRIASMGIPYDQLPMHAKDIGKAVNTELTAEWVERRGISIVSMALSSITPDAESAKKIAQFQESRVYTNANMMGARIGTAQATAMENASSNPNGAMNGFIGMGFAQQAGGMNAAQMFQMGGQQGGSPQGGGAPTGGAPAGGGAAAAKGQWTCSCGAVNTGAFCMECGKKKPEADGWTCECGAVNTGKFCQECGRKKPGEKIKCDKCGWELPEGQKVPKFCPECGDPITDADKV